MVHPSLRAGSGGFQAGPRDWAARLPFPVAMGPHRLVVEWRAPDLMGQPVARIGLDLAAARIELRQDLRGLALAQAFLEVLACLGARLSLAMPADRGAAQACEFASTLIEFAHRNPAAWLWFNLLLGAHLPGRPRFDRAARAALPAAPEAPMEVRIGARRLTVQWIGGGLPPAAGGKAARHMCDPGTIELPAGAPGSTLAVQAVRALTRSLHEAAGLGSADSMRRHRRIAIVGWIRLARENPPLWHWLAWTLSTASH
jgi:hypothetical protein